MRDHSKLWAFELADQLVLLVYRHTGEFPREEQFGLTLQLRRAAFSIASNIVEGCARQSSTDYIRFLEISYGSAREVESQLSVAHRLKFLSDESHCVIASAAIETSKVLSGLIRSLRSQ